MAAASSKTRPPELPCPGGPPREKLDWTKSRFEPRLVICSEIVASVPALMATMMMTAATPMIMPSMVRNERTLFLRIASQAMRMASDGFMLHPVCVVFFSIVCDVVHTSIAQCDCALGVLGDPGIVGHH